MTETKLQEDSNNGTDCSPLSSIYCNLKIRLTGSMNKKDLNKLYRCTLCNSCGLAVFNRGTREKAVDKSLISSHLIEISRNIMEVGNSYGIITDNTPEHCSMETVLFKGCTPTHKTPEILEAAESLLKSEGIKYGVISNETCCGNILFNLGDHASGLGAVQRNIAKFKAAGVKRIITICPGCYNAFNKYYRGCDGFNPEIVLAVDLLNGLTLKGEGFIIQDPCHAKEKSSKVRKILPGSKDKGASPCCGAGGGVMAHDKQLASIKARKTVENLGKIVTYCPFCYINLQSVSPDRVADIYMLLENQNKVYQDSK